MQLAWLSTKLCHLRVRNNPLCYFTHVHEQQGECQDPSQVVSREVQPGVVVNLHFGALASPAWEMIARKEEAYLTASQWLIWLSNFSDTLLCSRYKLPTRLQGLLLLKRWPRSVSVAPEFKSNPEDNQTMFSQITTKEKTFLATKKKKKR